MAETRHLQDIVPLPTASQAPVSGMGEQSKNAFFVGCWNCRGLVGSEPYIQTLVSKKPGILVLVEHCLWPYNLI